MLMAIIPARGGSKGVPGKNLRLLGGYPLLTYAIVAARLTELIGRVVVSTDSPEIAAVANEYGAETPFLRPPELAQDHSPDLDFMTHAIRWFEEHEGAIPEYLVFLRPTTPLRDPAIINAAITTIIGNETATSLRSAHPASESPHKWFQRDANGYFKGLWGGYDNDALNQPRQEFPAAYIPDGYVDVVKPAYILSSGQLYGDRMLGLITPDCIEVDTLCDLERLEYELSKNGSALWDYLRKNQPERGPDHGGV